MDQGRPHQGLRFSRVLVYFVGGEAAELPDLGNNIFGAATARLLHADATAQGGLGRIEATVLVVTRCTSQLAELIGKHDQIDRTSDR